MTEELSIQQKSPSAVPYFATGAVVGGAGTWGLSKMDWAKKYVTDAKYSSLQDIVNEAEDTFTKAASEASEEQKPFFEKAKAYREELAKYDADLKAYQEANKAGVAAELPEELLQKKAELEKALETRRQTLIEEEMKSIKAAATAQTKAVDPAKIKNVKALLENEVKLHETTSKDLNKAIKEWAEAKFTAVNEIDTLKQQLETLKKAGAPLEDIKYVKDCIKVCENDLKNAEKEINEYLKKQIGKEFSFTGTKSAKKKAIEAKVKEIETYVQDVVAEKTYNNATISTESLIKNDLHALDAIKATNDKKLISLAENFKENPTKNLSGMQRQIGAEKMRLEKLQKFKSLYEKALEAAPAGEKKVIEEQINCFGRIYSKTRTITITPEVTAIENMWKGFSNAEQETFIRLLGDHTADAKGIEEAIKAQSKVVNALETTVQRVNSVNAEITKLAGEGGYLKKGVLYGKDGKVANLKPGEISLSVKEIEVPKTPKHVSLEKQLAQLEAAGANGEALTEAQIREKAIKAVDDKADDLLRTEKANIADHAKKIAEEQAKLPKTELTAEQLAEKFAKEHGTKESIANKYKDDLAKGMEGKVSNKKLAMYIAGGALAVGLLATMLKPKSNNA